MLPKFKTNAKFPLGNDDVTFDHIKRMQGNNWYMDTIILHMTWAAIHAQSDALRHKVVVLSSMFWCALTTLSLDSTVKYTKHLSITSLMADMLITISMDDHFFYIALSFEEQAIFVMDGYMHGAAKSHNLKVDLLRRWYKWFYHKLTNNYIVDRTSPYYIDNWKVYDNSDSDISPRQTDGYSCGPYCAIGIYYWATFGTRPNGASWDANHVAKIRFFVSHRIFQLMDTYVTLTDVEAFDEYSVLTKKVLRSRGPILEETQQKIARLIIKFLRAYIEDERSKQLVNENPKRRVLQLLDQIPDVNNIPNLYTIINTLLLVEYDGAVPDVDDSQIHIVESLQSYATAIRLTLYP